MANTKSQMDVIVIGAGAAGMMCALTAGQRGLRVLLLDHAKKIGAKILISGGGRCNFTNHEIKADRYLSQNAHFAKSALSQYTQHHFIELVKKHDIAFHEKTLGQLFCDGSARQIVAMLEHEMRLGHVDVRTNCTIESVRKTQNFEVQTSLGVFHAPQFVIATGAPAIPQMGATGFAYEIAKQFGLNVIEPRPALVPLTAYPKDLEWISSLAGVSVPCTTQIGKTRFAESLLFTHKGLSGPAILQISSYWKPGQPILIDLLPTQNAFEILKDARASKPKSELQTILRELLPARLADALGARLKTFERMADAGNDKLQHISQQLHQWSFLPSGTEGFAKAEVCAGGIDTDVLSSKTMEAKNVPGLYFIGECVDVTGWLGGYNFQWAWSSGVATARDLS